MNLLIVTKDNCKKAHGALLKLLDISHRNNLNVFLQEKDIILGKSQVFKNQNIDLGIALGGDGTMLKLSSLIQKYTVKPTVASFSLGTLGFLLPLSKYYII